MSSGTSYSVGSSAAGHPRLRLAWVPIVLLTAAIAVVQLADLQGTYEAPLLLTALNFIFSTLVCLLVVVLIGRSFYAQGAWELLFLGCGVVLWCLALTTAPLLLRFGVNVAVTVHNLLVWTSAACHVTGVMLSFGRRRRARLGGTALIMGYGGAIALAGLVTIAAVRQMTPVFFVQGQGGTLLRTGVLATAVAMFAVAASVLLQTRHKSVSSFLHWYALALLLMAVGVLGVMLETATGGVLSWLGRAGQMLGGVYLFVAALAAVRESGAWRASLAGALRDSEDRYRMLFQHMTEGFSLHEVITDEAGGPCDYRFLEVNPAFEQLTGLSRADLLGRRVREVLPNTEAYWIEEFGRVALTGEPVHLENFSAELGRWYEAFAYQTTPGQFAVVFTDVTQRKQAEEALRRSEAIYRRLAEANLVGVGFGDTKGNVTFVNDEMLRMMGYTREDYEAGRVNWAACIAPEYREAVAPWSDKLLREGQVTGYERAFLRPDGGRTPYLGAAALVDPDSDLHVSIALDLTKIRAAEERVRESEERLRMALDAAHLVSFEWDIQRDQVRRFQSSTPPLAPMSGDNFATFEAMAEGVHPDDRAQFRANVEAALTREDGEYESEFRIIGPDGEVVWLHDRGRVEHDADGRPIRLIGLSQDITERRQAEESLARERGLLDSVMRTTDVMLAMLDPQFNFVWVNEAYARTCRRTPEALVGRNHFDLYPGEENEAIFRKVRDTGEPVFYKDKPFTFPDQPERGVTYWDWSLSPVRDARGKVTALVFTLRETTEFVRAQTALAQSEERLRLATTAANLGVFEWDVAEDTARWENERMYQISGRTHEDGPLTRAEFVADVLDPRDREAFEGALADAMRPGAGFHVECRARRKSDGEMRWIEMSGRFEFAADGSPRRLVAVLADITDRRRGEEALRAWSETLEQQVAEQTEEVRRQADQLRALAAELSRAEQRERRRLSLVLHDHIQQLIVGARMQLSWLKRNGNPDRVTATAQGVDSILNETLQASRNLAVDLSPPALHEAGLVGGLNWLARRVREKNQFTLHLRADNDAEPVDEETRLLLFECVRELVFNVIKYAGVAEAEATLSRTAGRSVRLTVSDAGDGFDPELLKRRRPDETTFGLFSIQERLAYIGGRMDIETAPGEGTRVVVTAPIGEVSLGEGPENAGVRMGPEAVSMHRKGDVLRVLIVDDHEILREGLTGLLELESGIEVVGEADDGPKAIELAAELEPDVIIMDVNLGEMNGVEATRRILARDPEIKVIGLSMHIDADVATAMRDAGATAYLTKGGPSEDLIAAIRACAEAEVDS